MTTGYRHGVYTSELPTSLVAPRTVNSNVVFAVGTAAIDTLAADKPRYVNAPRMYFSYDEYVAEMGWDEENFSLYTLQELVYCHFALYGGAPLVLVNVLDPELHETFVSAEPLTFAANARGEMEARLAHKRPLNLVLSNGDTTYVEGTHYVSNTVKGTVTLIGQLRANTTPLTGVTASYAFVDASLVDSMDIIGGIDLETAEPTGLEHIDSVFPMFRQIVGSILAPRFCEDPAVAVVMAAKADGFNGLFKCIAIADIPSDGENGITNYTQVPGYKNSKNLADELLIVCWPKVKLGERMFGLATHLTGLISQTDGDREGIPYASPSNKRLEITSMGHVQSGASGKDENWKELWLGLEKVNFLNGEGIYSISNFDGGFKSWGGRMSVYPSNTDPKDCQDAIRRFFNWYQAQFILTYFVKVDNPLNRRQIQTILKSEQIKLDGYTAREIILGGKISFTGDFNPLTDLMDGIARFHLQITPPPANRVIEGIFEFDPENLKTLFG